MLYLDVPYEEKDEAKALGARWDARLKKWYIKNRDDYRYVLKWVMDEEEDEGIILFDHFYLVEGKRKCYRCKRETPVIAFGADEFYVVYDDSVTERIYGLETYCNEIHIISDIVQLSKDFLDYLNRKYNYRMGYSKTTDRSYMTNHCTNCNAIQGDYYLHGEVDSPFFIDSIDKAKSLKIYRIPLDHDYKVKCSIGYGSEDWLIDQYAQMIFITTLMKPIVIE